MFFTDDMVSRHHTPTTNIDYLDCEYSEYLSNNLNLVNLFEDIHDDFLRSRLRNACWRRQAINLQNLDRCSPLVINWNKMGDITWLYGPMYLKETALDDCQPTAKDAHANADAKEDDDTSDTLSDTSDSDSLMSCDDICSISSYDSGYMPDTERTKVVARKRLSASEPLNMYSSNMRKYGPRKTKKVTFNCVISSREEINGRICDYDYLDECWL